MNLQSLIKCWSSVRECQTIPIFSKSSNSLVLHRASPSVHNVPTGKMAKNLTCRLTRGRRVAFCKPEDFGPAMTIFARKNARYRKTRPNLLAKIDLLRPKFFVFLQTNKHGDPPFLLPSFTRDTFKKIIC